MSKDIHNQNRRESGRKTQVKVRVDSGLVDEFDEWANSAHESRSAALRELMRGALGKADEYRCPREPPTDDTLNKGYRLLVDLAGTDGKVSHDIATAQLAKSLGISEELVTRTVLKKLRKRGYLQQIANVYGEKHYELRGWNERD